jgi:hypothetical protein
MALGVPLAQLIIAIPPSSHGDNWRVAPHTRTGDARLRQQQNLSGGLGTCAGR